MQPLVGELSAQSFVSGQTIATTTFLDPDRMESRRMLAAEMLGCGMTKAEVARRLEVTRTTVGRWRDILVSKGQEGLRKRRASGRPSGLRGKEEEFLKLYQEGPKAVGLEADQWTLQSFTEAVFSHLGVSYHPDHISKILRKHSLRPRRGKRS